jgi:hypothetical protein
MTDTFDPNAIDPDVTWVNSFIAGDLDVTDDDNDDDQTNQGQ